MPRWVQLPCPGELSAELGKGGCSLQRVGHPESGLDPPASGGCPAVVGRPAHRLRRAAWRRGCLQSELADTGQGPLACRAATVRGPTLRVHPSARPTASHDPSTATGRALCSGERGLVDTLGCPEAQQTPLTLGSRAGGCSSSWPGGGLGVKGQSLVSGAESWIRPSSPAAQLYGVGQVAAHPGPGSPICPGALIMSAPRVAGRREGC